MPTPPLLPVKVIRTTHNHNQFFWKWLTTLCSVLICKYYKNSDRPHTMSFIYICCFEFWLFLPLVKHPMTRKLCIYTHTILTRCCHIIVKRRVMVMKPNKFLCCRFLFAFLALTVHTTEELTNRNILIMYNVSVQKKWLCTVVDLPT